MTADLPDRAADRERCPHGWRDARCGRFGDVGPCGCERPAAALAARPAPDDGEEGIYAVRRIVASIPRLTEAEQDAAALDYAETALSETWAALRRIAEGEPDPRRIAADMLEAHGHDPAAPSSPVSGDALRRAVADELARHADTMRWSDNDADPVTVELGCRCGFERGTVTAKELAADLDGRMRAYRLHVADAVIAVLNGPQSPPSDRGRAEGDGRMYSGGPSVGLTSQDETEGRR